MTRLATFGPLAWSALLCVWGCAQILDANGYSRRSEDAGVDGEPGADAERTSADAAADSGDAAANPFLPKAPYLMGSVCTPCIDTRCASETAACDEDEFCRSHLEAARALAPDAAPGIAPLLNYMKAAWDYDHEGAGGWRAFAGLRACVDRRCSAECELGRDFACVGGFDWPRSYPERSTLRFRFLSFFSAPPLQGLSLRACPPYLDDCHNVMASADTDEAGFATLDIDFALKPPQSDMPEFNGFLLTDAMTQLQPTGGGAEYPAFRLQSSRPLLDQEYATIFLPDRASYDTLRRSLDLAPEAPVGLLVVGPYDCRWEYAKGVVLEIWKATPQGVRPCVGCSAVLYPNDSNAPDPTLKEFSTAGDTAIVAVPAERSGSLTLVVLRDTATRFPLAIARVAIRADELPILFLYPASRDELADFPQLIE